MKHILENIRQAHKDTEGQLAPMWNCDGCKLRRATGELVKASRPYVVIPLADLPKCDKCGKVATREGFSVEPGTENFCDSCTDPDVLSYRDYLWAKYLRENP